MRLGGRINVQPNAGVARVLPLLQIVMPTSNREQKAREALRLRGPYSVDQAPFHRPRPVRVAVTSTIHAVRLAAIVMLLDTDTTEAAWIVLVRCVTGVPP